MTTTTKTTHELLTEACQNYYEGKRYPYYVFSGRSAANAALKMLEAVPGEKVPAKLLATIILLTAAEGDEADDTHTYERLTRMQANLTPKLGLALAADCRKGTIERHEQGGTKVYVFPKPVTDEEKQAAGGPFPIVTGHEAAEAAVAKAEEQEQKQRQQAAWDTLGQLSVEAAQVADALSVLEHDLRDANWAATDKQAVVANAMLAHTLRSLRVQARTLENQLAEGREQMRAAFLSGVLGPKPKKSK